MILVPLAIGVLLLTFAVGAPPVQRRLERRIADAAALAPERQAADLAPHAVEHAAGLLARWTPDDAELRAAAESALAGRLPATSLREAVRRRINAGEIGPDEVSSFIEIFRRTEDASRRLVELTRAGDRLLAEFRWSRAAAVGSVVACVLWAFFDVAPWGALGATKAEAAWFDRVGASALLIAGFVAVAGLVAVVVIVAALAPKALSRYNAAARALGLTEEDDDGLGALLLRALREALPRTAATPQP